MNEAPRKPSKSLWTWIVILIALSPFVFLAIGVLNVGYPPGYEPTEQQKMIGPFIEYCYRCANETEDYPKGEYADFTAGDSTWSILTWKEANQILSQWAPDEAREMAMGKYQNQILFLLRAKKKQATPRLEDHAYFLANKFVMIFYREPSEPTSLYTFGANHEGMNETWSGSKIEAMWEELQKALAIRRIREIEDFERIPGLVNK